MNTSNNNLPAHARPAAETLHALSVDPVQGLTAAEAVARLAQKGPNALIEGRRRGLCVLRGPTRKGVSGTSG